MFNLGPLLSLISTEPVTGRASIVVECSAVKVFKFGNYPLDTCTDLG